MIANNSLGLGHDDGSFRDKPLRARDYLFIYLPLLLPFFLSQLHISIFNSLAYVMYYAYASLYVVKNMHRLSREDIYFIISIILIAFQIAIGNRLGLNSCLSLFALVIVYKEGFQRINIMKCIRIMIGLYVINVLYMGLEIISQRGLFPLLIDPTANPFSIIPGFMVGSSLYMHSSVPALIAIVAIFGSFIGLLLTKKFKYRVWFLVAGLLALTLAVFDIRGTSLVSFVLATIVVIMIKASRKGFLIFLFLVVFTTILFIVYYDPIIDFLGYRFADKDSGEFDKALISMYLDVFFSLVILWYDASLFDKLIGQSIGSIEGKVVHGDFAFGNILYFEGAIIFFIYCAFIIHQIRLSVKSIYNLPSFEAGVVYFNIFAIIVYFVSLIHYGNAISLGVANLCAIHIVLNILIRKAYIKKTDLAVADNRG
jgi:hypothetical protein